MSKNQFDAMRRRQQQIINDNPGDRESLAKEHGDVWDTRELQRDFEVVSFAAPFVLVIRKSDGATGALMFQHNPRFYFGFTKED